ncbi:MAG: hypothetical protein WA705_27945 [Candidatus Ozemobacteraceae bacterium]
MKTEYGRMRFFVLFLFLFVGFFCPIRMPALDCPACGAKGLTSLTMYCPSCREKVHTPEVTARQKKTSVLKIEVVYTGDKPERLPEKGRILFDGRPKGELILVERAEREKFAVPVEGKHGVGIDYTALYRGEIRELSEGVVDVCFEMKFPWGFNLFKTVSRIQFPHIGFKRGETVNLHHEFKSFDQFSRRGKSPEPSDKKSAGKSSEPEKKLEKYSGRFPEKVPDKNSEKALDKSSENANGNSSEEAVKIPVESRKSFKDRLPDLPRLRTGTGTLSLEIPLME